MKLLVGLTLSAVALTSGAYGQSTSAATNYSDPFAFCKAVGDTDWTEGNSYPGYIGPQSPQAVVKVIGEPAGWRCIGGDVYGCYPGASGRACLKRDPSTRPTPGMMDYCHLRPNSDFIDNATTGSSAHSWKCTSGKAVIDHIASVDEHGYYKGAWKRVSP